MISPLPVCIDLDGTLLRTDVLSEALLIFVRQYPFKIGLLLWWFLQGRAVLKYKIAQCISLPVELLPVNQKILKKIHFHKSQGHRLYLVTAAPHRYALACAARFNLFDDVLSSNLQVNLRSHAKAKLLVEKFGSGGYIYAGNSRHDIPVWAQAAEIIAINTPKAVVQKIKAFHKPMSILVEEQCQGKDFFKALKYYFNFSKPFIFSTSILGYLIVRKTTDSHFLEFIKYSFICIAFSFIASGFWILKDLFQLNTLRKNEKFSHPIANGALPLGQTLRTALIFMALGIQLLFWAL